MAQANKTCQNCGERGHSKFYCTNKPLFKTIKRTPIRRVGKKTFKWLHFRQKYLKNHQPNDEGYYICYICQKWILPEEVTLDHIVARSHDATLVFDESNIRICCGTCNSSKGSQSLENYMKSIAN